MLRKSPSQWSHFSTWLKQLPPRFLEIAIFLIQLGALSPWQCSFSFEPNSLRISALFSLKCFWRLEGHWEQPKGTSAGCGSPIHSCWERYRSKQCKEQNWGGATKLPRGADSLRESCITHAGHGGMQTYRSLPHTQTLPPPPIPFLVSNENVTSVTWSESWAPLWCSLLQQQNDDSQGLAQLSVH